MTAQRFERDGFTFANIGALREAIKDMPGDTQIVDIDYQEPRTLAEEWSGQRVWHVTTERKI